MPLSVSMPLSQPLPLCYLPVPASVPVAISAFVAVSIHSSASTVAVIRNKLEFKQKLKEHLLGQLKDSVTCDRLLCPQCHPPDRL
jgi:hypothetical protein